MDLLDNFLTPVFSATTSSQSASTGKRPQSRPRHHEPFVARAHTLSPSNMYRGISISRPPVVHQQPQMFRPVVTPKPTHKCADKPKVLGVVTQVLPPIKENSNSTTLDTTKETSSLESSHVLHSKTIVATSPTEFHDDDSEETSTALPKAIPNVIPPPHTQLTASSMHSQRTVPLSRLEISSIPTAGPSKSPPFLSSCSSSHSPLPLLKKATLTKIWQSRLITTEDDYNTLGTIEFPTTFSGRLMVTLVGGGGGGGGSSASSQGQPVGGGGGSGAAVVRQFIYLTLGGRYQFCAQVGLGGSGGELESAGKDGNNSTFQIRDVSTGKLLFEWIASGGKGGLPPKKQDSANALPGTAITTSSNTTTSLNNVTRVLQLSTSLTGLSDSNNKKGNVTLDNALVISWKDGNGGHGGSTSSYNENTASGTELLLGSSGGNTDASINGGDSVYIMQTLPAPFTNEQDDNCSYLLSGAGGGATASGRGGNSAPTVPRVLRPTLPTILTDKSEIPSLSTSSRIPPTGGTSPFNLLTRQGFWNHVAEKNSKPLQWFAEVGQGGKGGAPQLSGGAGKDGMIMLEYEVLLST